eukprot:2050000-Prymnesium_polylepis.2
MVRSARESCSTNAALGAVDPRAPPDGATAAASAEPPAAAPAERPAAAPVELPAAPPGATACSAAASDAARSGGSDGSKWCAPRSSARRSAHGAYRCSSD